MSQKRISYKTAEKIIDIYSGLLISKKRTIYQKFGYSELQGYDIIDVDNALKLRLAYSIYNTYTIDEKAIKTFEKTVQEHNNGLWQFFYHFVPDEIIPDFDSLDADDKESMLKSIQLGPDYEDSEYYKKFQDQETQGSFLQFCLSVGQEDINYWEKIYARLNLIWDERDPKDPIYICIKEKKTFHDIFLKRKEILSQKPSDTDQEGEPVTKEKTVSFLQKHKAKIFHFLWFALMILGIYNTVLQKIVLITIAGLVLINILVMKDSFKHKWEMPYNVFLLIVLLSGIIFSAIGFYATILVLISEIAKTILYAINKLVANNSNLQK